MAQSVWDRAAGLYRLQVALERPALVEAVVLAAPRRLDRVLDLGTGTAAMLGQLARAADPPELAVGVDSSAGMLARAVVLPERWQLLRADARELPFEARSFELVTAAYVLHLLPSADRRTLLSETARVLAPKGRVVVVTPAPARSLLGRALSTPLGWAAGRSSGVLAGFRPLDPRGDLELAGFVVRAVRYVDRGYRSWCVLAQPRAG
ncbi:MAG: class I SAM-dependent methyltransferase [Gaiellaceae bacterium]